MRSIKSNQEYGAFYFDFDQGLCAHAPSIVEGLVTLGEPLQLLLAWYESTNLKPGAKRDWAKYFERWLIA